MCDQICPHEGLIIYCVDAITIIDFIAFNKNNGMLGSGTCSMMDNKVTIAPDSIVALFYRNRYGTNSCNTKPETSEKNLQTIDFVVDNYIFLLPDHYIIDLY